MARYTLIDENDTPIVSFEAEVIGVGIVPSVDLAERLATAVDEQVAISSYASWQNEDRAKSLRKAFTDLGNAIERDLASP